jgi:hypothetical protein
LLPGQHVHLNKACIHAFRKVVPFHPLAPDDCHAAIHARTFDRAYPPSPASSICASVAYDFQFRGYDAEGINREHVITLENAALNRNRKVLTLAIPEICILKTAEQLVTKAIQSEGGGLSLIGFACTPAEAVANPGDVVLARGILPSLMHIAARCGQKESPAETFRLSKKTDQDDPSSFDPCDLKSYYCEICFGELSVDYMHCEGCEYLRKVNYNLCLHCFGKGSWQINKVLEDSAGETVFQSNVTHTAKFSGKRKNCGGPQAALCMKCAYCVCCSCNCHKNFTYRCRFNTLSRLGPLVDKTAKIATSTGLSPVLYSEETGVRLLVAADRTGLGLIAKRNLLEPELRVLGREEETMETLRAIEATVDERPGPWIDTEFSFSSHGPFCENGSHVTEGTQPYNEGGHGSMVNCIEYNS